MSKRRAERVPDRLSLLADPQPVLPGVRVLLADLFKQVSANRHRKRRLPPWQQRPLAADQIVVRAEPPAVLWSNLVGEVLEIGEMVEVEIGVAKPRAVKSCPDRACTSAAFFVCSCRCAMMSSLTFTLFLAPHSSSWRLSSLSVSGTKLAMVRKVSSRVCA